MQKMTENLVGKTIPPAATISCVQGRGYCTDDHRLPGECGMSVLRSPHASADIRLIDTGAAAASPGVLAVFTGDDVKADGLRPIRSLLERKRPDGYRRYEPPFDILAKRHVRHFGFPVAIILAETLADAHGAAELIDVDDTVRTSVTRTADLMKPGAPLVWDDAPEMETPATPARVLEALRGALKRT